MNICLSNQPAPGQETIREVLASARAKNGENHLRTAQALKRKLLAAIDRIHPLTLVTIAAQGKPGTPVSQALAEFEAEIGQWTSDIVQHAEVCRTAQAALTEHPVLQWAASRPLHLVTLLTGLEQNIRLESAGRKEREDALIRAGLSASQAEELAVDRTGELVAQLAALKVEIRACEDACAQFRPELAETFFIAARSN